MLHAASGLPVCYSISSQHFLTDFDISSSRSAWIPCPYTEFEEEVNPFQRQVSEAYLEVPCSFCDAPQRANPV